MVENKIIVMLRLQDGDSIECSVKTRSDKFSVKDIETFKKKIHSKFKSHISDALYFTIRISMDKKKDNFKSVTFTDFMETLDGLLKIYSE